MERNVHDSFSLFDLESDLFRGSTTHEVHNERTLLGRKQQLIDPWDPGVWAPKDEDETKFEEEAQETWGSHDDTIVRYDGNSVFYMHHNSKSLNLRGLDINEETCKKQLMVLVENEVQTLSKLDDMKSLVENLIQKTPRNQYEQIVSLVDFQNIKSTIGDMKSTYLNMIKDRDVATKIVDKAISTSKELRMKVKELTSEFKSTKNALGNTQNALLEVEDYLYVAKQFREQVNRERDKKNQASN